MVLISDELDRYVSNHTEKEPDYLQELNRKTHLEVLQPRMLSGHYQGRVLSLLSHMIQPKRILEIGTYTGYSALCLAEGLQEDGLLITIDVNEELEEMVNSFIEKSGMRNQIINRVGDALDIIPTLEEEFDLVFIDADKMNYINYYNCVFDKVKKGGYIISDNVLWSGKVLGEYDQLDKSTQLLMDYNQLIHEDDRVQEVLLPIRDGIMIARKK